MDNLLEMKCDLNEIRSSGVWAEPLNSNRSNPHAPNSSSPYTRLTFQICKSPANTFTFFSKQFSIFFFLYSSNTHIHCVPELPIICKLRIFNVVDYWFRYKWCFAIAYLFEAKTSKLPFFPLVSKWVQFCFLALCVC